MAAIIREASSLPEISMLKHFALITAIALTASLAHAADARWFRYYNEKNQPTVTDVVTPEHVARGYDELTASMQLIRHVPAQKTLTAAEAAAVKAKRDAELQRAKDDKQLLRLYSRTQDAELARNRQVDALQVRIDFSNSQIVRLRQNRAAEAQKAAVFERTGKPVPADLKESIAEYDRQIKGAQAEVDARKAEQEKVRADFVSIIKRLEELTGQPASTPTATAPAAAAAAPAKPATPAPAKP
jgi:hypothetical protein